MNTSVSRVTPGRRHALTRPTPVRARSHETQGRRGKSSPLFKCQGSWRAKATMESLAKRPSGAPPSGQPPEFTDLEGSGQVEPGSGVPFRTDALSTVMI